MAYNLSPIGECQFTDANGAPYSGAKLFIYTAGSSTKVTTYQDNGGITPHANPIILNTKGEVADGSGNRKPIWLPSGASYKFILAPSTDTDPPSSSYWTIDNIVGINDTTVTISEWITGPTPTYVSATSFTLVGDQTSVFHIGRKIKTTNSGGTIYSVITNSVFGAVTTITVANDLGSLDAGLSAVYYGIASAINSSIPRIGTILSKTASYAVTNANHKSLVIFSGLSAGVTATLQDGAPAGFEIWIEDKGDTANAVTISRQATATLYADAANAGVNTYILSRGERVYCRFDGTNWTLISNQSRVIGNPTGGDKGVGTFNTSSDHYVNGNLSSSRKVIETQLPSASATVTFSSVLTNGVRYRIDYDGTQNTVGARIILRFNGDFTAGRYQYANYGLTGAAVGTNSCSISDNAIVLDDSATAGEEFFGHLEFIQALNNLDVNVESRIMRAPTGNNSLHIAMGNGHYGGAAGLTSVTILVTSGTLTGTFTLSKVN